MARPVRARHREGSVSVSVRLKPERARTALVADDEVEVCELAADLLRDEGFRVVTANDGPRALELFETQSPDVAILDIEMPGYSGFDILQRIKQAAPRVPVIMITGYADVKRAVTAMRHGAYDFLTKPLVLEDLLATIVRALERESLLEELDSLRRRVKDGPTLSEVMGSSPAIQAVIEDVHRLAASRLSVVIFGETGTGKELVARAIHRHGDRAARPFVALDCGAMPDTLIESELFGYERGAFTGADRRKDGYFQMADGGTLFLDEVTNLPLATQAKLLRVLQERTVQPLGATRTVTVDVRVVAASNVALEPAVQAGRFRQDLYYRLNEFTIPLPPLRERRDDVAHLATRFLAEANLEVSGVPRTLSEATLAALAQHDWPGNVRQLRSVVRRAAIVASGPIGPEHLRLGGAEAHQVPAESTEPRAIPEGGLKALADAAMVSAESDAIRRALRTARGNKSVAARALCVDFKTLHLKMKRYGIGAKEFC
jgi:two-component system nitrogen regulation response regulator GlnG